MRLVSIASALMIAVLPAAAQPYQTQVTVLDQGTPVAGANVVAIEANTGTRVDSTLTDAQGVALFSLSPVRVSREDAGTLPRGVGLSLFPNPTAAGQANAAIEVPTAGPVRLVTYDLLGREVARLSTYLAAGAHTVRVPGTEVLATGTYFVSMQVAEGVSTRSFVIMDTAPGASGVSPRYTAPGQPLALASEEVLYRFEISAEGYGTQRTPSRDISDPTQATFEALLTEAYTNSLGMAFSRIPAGTFQMGDIQDTGQADEIPVHQVTISQDFFLGSYEVTRAQWIAVIGSTTRLDSGCGDDCPAEGVSWDSVQVFIEALNGLDPDNTYRLPTEAEWEYAARAGTDTRYSWGNEDPVCVAGAANGARVEDEVNCDFRGPVPVGTYSPNAWGLYDMHGNVWEWASDWYDGLFYRESPGTDPLGPESGSRRVIRGGSWADTAFLSRSPLRSAARLSLIPRGARQNHGFRLVRMAR
ncbi:MAG: SUMF1/EgtB/PvdO family nonheme iron enzyme [Bacteroidota bacterium]